jgi:tetratricopeptide (TPR) repeat protein
VKSYEDKSTPLVHGVKWGHAYNHIGAPLRALSFLEPVFKDDPKTPGLIFEHAYSYNALERFNDAIAILEPAVKQEQANWRLCKELGYSYLNNKMFKQAVDQFVPCISGLQVDPSSKGEMALNLSQAYRFLGDGQACREWIARSREWAPQGSSVHAVLLRNPDDGKICGL